MMLAADFLFLPQLAFCRLLLQALIGGEGVTRTSVIPLSLMGFGVIFSVFVGLVSGYYPANKAVKIPALEAIKHE